MHLHWNNIFLGSDMQKYVQFLGILKQFTLEVVTYFNVHQWWCRHRASPYNDRLGPKNALKRKMHHLKHNSPRSMYKEENYRNK